MNNMNNNIDILWNAYWNLLETYKKESIERRNSLFQSACLDVLNDGLSRPSQNVTDFTMFCRSIQTAMDESISIKMET